MNRYERRRRRRRARIKDVQIGSCTLAEWPEVSSRILRGEYGAPRVLAINLSDRLRKFYEALAEVQAAAKRK